MTIETPATPHNEDLDKADRNDKWRLAVWVLALLLIGAVTWILMAQSNTAQIRASSEASQKFTLAQQVAAACAIKEQADDLGGLCEKATQIVKEGPTGSIGIQGPPGDTGPQGPLGPKGEQGVQGNHGVQGLIGAQGIFGKTGEPGIDGKTGEPGPLGEQGIAGPIGIDGIVGPVGSAGADGIAGPVGPTGADGIAGPVGPIGPAGGNGSNGQLVFPFSFTFTSTNGTFSCTITASDAIATCVAN